MNAIAALPDVHELSVMTYKGVAVTTTRMLEAFYGCEPGRLRKNYQNHKDRFREGEHLFHLEGEELRAFTGIVPNKDHAFGIRPFAVRAILWSAKGAARHAKMLDTEKAWEVYEKMEDAYFNRQRTASPPPQKALPQPPGAAPQVFTLTQFEKLVDESRVVLSGREILEIRDRLHARRAPRQPRQPVLFTRKGKTPRLTRREKTQIWRLYTEGVSSMEIARQVSRDQSTVCRYVRRRKTHSN